MRTLRQLHTASRNSCSSFGRGRSEQEDVRPPSAAEGSEILAGARASANRSSRLPWPATRRSTPSASPPGQVRADVRRSAHSILKLCVLNPFAYVSIAGVKPQVLEARENSGAPLPFWSGHVRLDVLPCVIREICWASFSLHARVTNHYLTLSLFIQSLAAI